MAPASKGERTRQSILDAAVVRFGREGYRSTSVAQVARDAGVSGTLAYAYFTDKEALFLAAVDADASAVVSGAMKKLFEDPTFASQWRRRLIYELVEAVEGHPLTRRILAGQEPDVVDRVLDLPALAHMRKACVALIQNEQALGTMRTDIDAALVGNGVVTILLSILMSILQVGAGAIDTFRDEVDAVFDAALDPVAQPARRRPARLTRGSLTRS